MVVNSSTLLREINKKIIILLISLIFSNTSYSKEVPTKEIYNTMKEYILAIKNKDENKLINCVSKKYLKGLRKKGLLKETFSKQNPKKPFKEFDLKINPIAGEPNTYFVNIKNKREPQYGNYWYILTKQKNKYIIDEMKMLD